MKLRIGNPPVGVEYPVWAWYSIDGKHKKPDLRSVHCRNYSGEMTCIEVEIPESDVLLSDMVDWHAVLNNLYLPRATNSEEYSAIEEWYKKLPLTEKENEKLRSWEAIFDTTYVVNDFETRGDLVQATFWELRYSQVVDVRKYKGRLNIGKTSNGGVITEQIIESH